MATEKLQVTLELVASQYKREAKQAASATGQIAASANDMGSATGRAGSSMMKLSGTMKAFLGAGLALKAGAAIKDFAADSIRAFSELEQSTGAVEAVFGSSMEKIDAWAKSAARGIGLSESQAKQSATVIGAFLQNYGFSVDDAAAKSIELTSLGADLAAMFGGTVPDAVAAISAALRGEFNPIERYGVSLRVATIEAHALEMGLASTKSELDQNSKMLAALDLITQQTSKAHGQFARELDTVAGKEAVFTAELENAKATLGASLAPAKNLFTGLSTWGVRSLSDMFAGLNRLTGAWDDATFASTMFTSAVQAGLSPAEAFADAMHELETGAGGFWHSFGKSADVLGLFDHKVDLSAEAAETLVRSLYDAVDGSDEARNALYRLMQQGDLTNEEFQEYSRILDEVDRQEQILNQTHNEAEHARWRVTDATEELAEETGDLTYAYKELNDKTLTSAERFDLLRQKQRDLLSPVDDLITANQRLSEAFEAVNEAVDEHGENSPEHIRALLDLAEAQHRVGAAARTAGETTEEAFRTMLETTTTLTASQIDMILEEMRRVDGFQFAPKSIVIGTNVRSLPGGAFKPFAAGGRPEPGVPAIVGEKGPELFIPDTAGTILSNRESMRQLSGGSAVAGSNTVINVGNVYGWDDFVAKVNKAGVDIRRLGLS